MKILVLGAGKMGSFFIDLLSFDHEVGVYEKDPKRLRFTYNCQRFQTLEEIREFKPELVINAVTVKYTIPAFEEVLPYLPKECIISDISSVKTGLKEWYEKSGHKSLHNKYYAKTMRNAVRKLRNMTDKEEAVKLYPTVQKLLDKLAKINVIHSNKAANLKSGLAQHIAKLG